MNIELRNLTIITGDNFSGKSQILRNQIKNNNSFRYINQDTRVDIDICDEVKDWFKIIFRTNYSVTPEPNYAIKIISAGLNCKEGELLIVENPEIGLHPKAVNKIAKFFTFLANNGVKVLIETNSTDFVNSVCYEVLRKNINNCGVVFYNKTRDNIDKININENGKFIDDNQKLVRYPSGFFDANTDEVWALL